MSTERVVSVCCVANLLGCFSAQIPDQDALLPNGANQVKSDSLDSGTGSANMSPSLPSPDSGVSSDAILPPVTPSVDAGVWRCSNRGADSSRWVELNFDGPYEGAIRDQNTGLVWTFFPAKNVHGTFQFWTDQAGAETYCNTMVHAGFSDWRLPSKDELLTLVDTRYQSPASGFPCITSTTHWSSDIYEEDNQLGWYVTYGTGVAAYDDGRRSTSRLFKCVR